MVGLSMTIHRKARIPAQPRWRDSAVADDQWPAIATRSTPGEWRLLELTLVELTVLLLLLLLCYVCLLSLSETRQRRLLLQQEAAVAPMSPASVANVPERTRMACIQAGCQDDGEIPRAPRPVAAALVELHVDAAPTRRRVTRIKSLPGVVPGETAGADR